MKFDRETVFLMTSQSQAIDAIRNNGTTHSQPLGGVTGVETNVLPG
jgi:hypothetical protein